MMVPLTRKKKKFPPLSDPDLDLVSAPVISAESEKGSESESDEPETVTLTGGRVAEGARSRAVEEYRQKLQEVKRAKNKSREAFIQATRSSATLSLKEEVVKSDEENDDELEEDLSVQVRVQRAMEDAEAEDETESSDEEMEEPSASSSRLPDSIFAAAAAAEQVQPELRQKKRRQVQDFKTKRRRVHESPSERVVGNRTVRVVHDLNAPPPPPSRVSQKTKAGMKGGVAFRRGWKKRDATRAQIRSRSGPAQKFVTSN